MSNKRYFGFLELSNWVVSKANDAVAQVNSALSSKANTADLGTASSANIFVSTVDPTAADGKDGDLWIKYTP